MFGGAANQRPALGSTGGMFSGPATGFGTSFGTAGGLGTTSFGAGADIPGYGLGVAAHPQLQQQQLPPNAIQQQLDRLTTNPYSDNPLFKLLLQDSGKREDILKPINPAAQRALDSSQYKISPHRNIKAKVKPISSVGNKSAIFDGLEDDDVNSSKKDLFVPRKSVKKLVIKPHSPATPRGVGSNLDETANNASVLVTSPSAAANLSMNKSADESLHLPVVKGKMVNPDRLAGQEDISFVANLKNIETSGSPGGHGHHSQASSDLSDNGDDDDDDDIENCPTGIVLKRAGYYTIPRLGEVAKMLDADGNCNVENFTIGREDYGNIFFPGVTNVAGLNLDEIVFIRNKEVIVYPDDSKKPVQGKGLNKKAQITLDKVWPVIKTKGGSDGSEGSSGRSSR
jgi:nuclear pore complex protein Nup98-Nup96